MNRLACVLCLASLGGVATAAEVLSAERLAAGRAVLQSIYSLDYTGAERQCQQMIQAEPEDPLGYVLLARDIWSEQLHKGQGLSIDRFSGSEFYYGTPDQRIPVSPEAERRFQDVSERAISLARARLARNPSDLDAMFLLGLILETRASYEFTIRASSWAAFKEGENALRLHRSVSQAAPDFADAKLALGVSYYAAASVPWTIRWLPYMLGYRGSKARGKQELEQVVEHGALLADDARTVLVLLHFKDGEVDRAMRGLEELGRRYPHNYLIPLELAAIELRQNQAQKAIDIDQRILAGAQNGAAQYAALEASRVYLRLGVATRASGDLQSSIAWLTRTLQEGASDLRLCTAAHLELGKTYDLRADRTAALEQYRLVLAAEDFLGSRREAHSLLAHPYHPAH